MKKDQREIFVTLKQRRFLLWTAATRATAVARHGFDCCFSLSSSRSLSLFPPSFFSFLCVASRHTKTAVTSPLVDAPRVASPPQRRKREFEFALFHCACHTHTRAAPVLRPPTVHRPASAYSASVTRLYHLPYDPNRARRIFRARNRHASRKIITRTFTRTNKCLRAFQIVRTRT